jgi:hypothetical protein
MTSGDSPMARWLPENYRGASGTGESTPWDPESETVLGAYILI